MRVSWWQHRSSGGDRQLQCSGTGRTQTAMGFEHGVPAWLFSACPPACLQCLFLLYLLAQCLNSCPYGKPFRGTRIQNKTLIKVHRTLCLGNCRSNLQDYGASFGSPSDMTLPASLGDRNIVDMLCSCCVSLGKHLSFSRPPFPHRSGQPHVKGERRGNSEDVPSGAVLVLWDMVHCSEGGSHTGQC